VLFGENSSAAAAAAYAAPGASLPWLLKSARWLALAVAAAALAACAQVPVDTGKSEFTAPRHRTAWVPARKRHHAVAMREHEPAGEHAPAGAAVGMASYYGGGRTASGEKIIPGELTAAHPSLPFGTRLRVTRVDTGRSVVVRVNDRGPFVKGRIVDVSHSAAEQLGLTQAGVAKVKIDVVQ
jgi:rare lipoprotein A